MKGGGRWYIETIKSILNIRVVREYIYANSYTLSKELLKQNNRSCVLMYCSGLCGEYKKGYIQWIKDKFDIKLVLYQYDPTDLYYTNICKEYQGHLDIFDYIYNINSDDARRYRHIYWPLIYTPQKVLSEEAIFNLYFCGFGIDRASICEKIAMNAQARNAIAKLIVFHYIDDNYYGVNVITKPISYEENLKNVFQSKCLLEIMHNQYDNPTMRYVEAVVYNKKLLTNNKNVVNYPYYDSRYMKIFADVNEIDWDWVISDEKVDYMYDGTFSPRLLLEDIKRRVK